METSSQTLWINSELSEIWIDKAKCGCHQNFNITFLLFFISYYLNVIKHSSDWNSQWDPWKISSEEKKPWVSVEILDLCGKRRELRKKRFEPEGSEKYKEVTNNIKRCMKKAEENWIGEQCSETEETLRKNNSKRSYQLVKDLTTVKQREATTVQDRSGKCLTEEWDVLNRWTEYCAELYNHNANGDKPVLDCPQTDTEDDHPTLRKEVEAALQSLKTGKSAGVDNVQAELGCSVHHPSNHDSQIPIPPGWPKPPQHMGPPGWP